MQHLLRNTHPTFTITHPWREEQNAYVGQVEDLIGIEGSVSTYEDALASRVEAIRAWQ